MEKTIQLDQREMQTAREVDQEVTLAWAQIGMFSEQLEQARKLRDAGIEKQKSLIKQALATRGIDNFEGARPGMQAGTVVVVLPDPVESSAQKVNGAAQLDPLEKAA